ncbi:MAG: hypothetical protein ACJAS1_005989 [Oleiphilaceae bacterium]|jgi:hypothetical protein
MKFISTLIFLFLMVISFSSSADCYELSKKIGPGEDEYFLTCASAFENVHYVVNQYIGENDAFGMISFRQNIFGFSCANTSSVSSCVNNPMGPFETTPEKSLNINSLRINKASDDLVYKSSDLAYRFPQVLSSKNENDCFVAAKSKTNIVLGINETDLASNIKCFLKLENFISSK